MKYVTEIEFIIVKTIPDNTILLDGCLFFAQQLHTCSSFASIHAACNLSGKMAWNFRRFEVKRLETNDKWHTSYSIYIIAVAHIFWLTEKNNWTKCLSNDQRERSERERAFHVSACMRTFYVVWFVGIGMKFNAALAINQQHINSMYELLFRNSVRSLFGNGFGDGCQNLWNSVCAFLSLFFLPHCNLKLRINSPGRCALKPNTQEKNIGDFCTQLIPLMVWSWTHRLCVCVSMYCGPSTD